LEAGCREIRANIKEQPANMDYGKLLKFPYENTGKENEMTSLAFSIECQRGIL